MTDLHCDICGQPADGVYASSIAPISYPRCSECLKAGREEYWLMLVAKKGRPWWYPSKAQLDYYGKTREQFFVDAEWQEPDPIKVSMTYVGLEPCGIRGFGLVFVKDGVEIDREFCSGTDDYNRA